MLPDSNPYNPNVLPPDGRSSFKLWVISQDEVPAGICSKPIADAGNQKDTRPEALIVQSAYKPAMVHTSAFANHSLKPQANMPQAISTRNQDWALGVFIICFVLLAFVRAAYNKRFGQIFKSFYNPRFTNQLMREGTLFNERITPPLILVYLTTICMLAYRVVQNVTGWQLSSSASYIMAFKIFAVVCALFFIRLIVIRLTAVIFKTQRETSDYLVNTMVISQVSVVFLLPLTACAFYMNHFAADAALYVSMVFFGLMVFYRIIRGFISGLSFSGYSLYYLILYLCTIEILPFFIVAKFALNYLKSSG